MACIEDKNKALVDYMNKEFSLKLEVIENFPIFSDEVHKHIKHKSKKDLPAIQFSNFDKFSNLSELVEVNGILGFGEELSEIYYYKSKLEDIKVKKNNGNLDIECFSFKFNVNELKKHKPNSIINWHTHPLLTPYTKEDLLDLYFYNKIYSSHFKKEVDTFSVLYLPGNDSFHWLKVGS
jgi:hypothetical protein